MTSLREAWSSEAINGLQKVAYVPLVSNVLGVVHVAWGALLLFVANTFGAVLSLGLRMSVELGPKNEFFDALDEFSEGVEIQRGRFSYDGKWHCMRGLKIQVPFFGNGWVAQDDLEYDPSLEPRSVTAKDAQSDFAGVKRFRGGETEVQHRNRIATARDALHKIYGDQVNAW